MGCCFRVLTIVSQDLEEFTAIWNSCWCSKQRTTAVGTFGLGWRGRSLRGKLPVSARSKGHGHEVLGWGVGGEEGGGGGAMQTILDMSTGDAGAGGHSVKSMFTHSPSISRGLPWVRPHVMVPDKSYHLHDGKKSSQCYNSTMLPILW